MLSHKEVTQSGLIMLAAAVLMLTPMVLTAGPPTERAEQFLADARTQAAQLAKDALALQAYTTGDLSALSVEHAALIERIDQDISKAGKLSFQMQGARGAASATQQEAIDRIDPLLKELAAILNTAAMRVRRVSRVMQAPPYTDYLRANGRLASDLARLIEDTVDCAEAKAQAEEIDRQIELINFD